jgi:hypothetical protein
MNGPTLRWLIAFTALICAIVSVTAAFAEAPAPPAMQAGGQIRLLPPPPMPLAIMIVETAPQPALGGPTDSNSAASTADSVLYVSAPAEAVPVQSAARADRLSYVLAPGEPVSVQSTAAAAPEAVYSPNTPFEGAAAPGPLVRALAQARASFDATNGFSVSVSLCSNDAQNQPIPHDVLSLTIRAASGRVLFGADITTDENGCHTGILTIGRGVTEPPALLSYVDEEGVSGDFPIAPPG